MRIKNFLFHRVSDDIDRLWPPMSLALFERVIRHLSRNYQVFLLEDILNDPAQVKLTSKKIATIQFDDGYKDNIENAVPILKKYNCPASFYVVSNCIDSGMPTWTYLLDHALQHTQIKELHLPFDFVPAEKKSIRENPANKLSELAKPIKPWLKKIPNNQRVIVLNAILEQCKDVSGKKDVMMSWNDIRKLIQEGFYIGSHSHTHPLLASIETEEEIIFELETSARRIEQETGRRPVTISYPIGSFDERVVRLARGCGYKYGLAVEQKFFHYNENLILEIPRVELYQEPFWKVYMRISGIINLFRNGGK